ncbi:hypothetical protein Q5P01_022795 [Channa striata]|uniref:Uncharacterized protein n=1 Tax=Channa striata TaxID=64152 RepID=A0AA88S7C4_CHASR|nr:hypothetical protein Q5P01_022795 [Channa striata]
MDPDKLSEERLFSPPMKSLTGTINRVFLSQFVNSFGFCLLSPVPSLYLSCRSRCSSSILPRSPVQPPYASHRPQAPPHTSPHLLDPGPVPTNCIVPIFTAHHPPDSITFNKGDLSELLTRVTQRMEACIMKPEVKTKPKPPKPPPKPAEIKSNNPEKPPVKPPPVKPPPVKPPPVVPPRPKDSELGQTRYQLATDTTNDQEKGSEGSPPENNKEKGGLFSGKIFRKSRKPTEAAATEEDRVCLNCDVSGSKDAVSEISKEKGGFFNVFLRKSNKIPGAETPGQTQSHDEFSSSREALSENTTKEKGGIFNGIFKKSPKVVEDAEIEVPDTKLLIRNESLSEQDSGGGLFSGFLKQTHKVSEHRTESLDGDAENEMSASSNGLSDGNTTKQEQDVDCEHLFSSSCENLTNTEGVLKVKRRRLPGIFQRSASSDNLFDEESPTGEEKKFSASLENLLEAMISKEKTRRLAGIFKKSPKPAPRSIATEDPLSSTKELSASWDSFTDAAQENPSVCDELLPSNGDLSDAKTTTKEKKVGFAGMFRRTPKPAEQQGSDDRDDLEGDELRRTRTIKKKRKVVSFRIKKTFPQIPEVTLSSQPQSADRMPVVEETVELLQLNQSQEDAVVEVQPVAMAPYPTEDNPLESEQDSDELMEWWNTVKGWTEWNETSHSQEEQIIMEQAADRVYLAARLFVRLFNQHGASLQHRILELLALADAADQFHKKTVKAAVGGGVASVVGSVATITGLVLAPFTFGASVIVTAVGISVATVGSITSATANITDTVHSSMDRKKVEKMIQGYQEEIKDIRECLEFVREGMDTLQEWDFEQYSQSAAKKALNHSVKHVVREGGRAGKELVINTDKLISTVHVLGAAGGAAKAAQVISITTGVMSALFLALDVFFLAKDSHELRKGAKTKFAAKIREVCKDLQDGLLELNKVKTQLQKTMDGIEVEEYEETEEVEVEVEDELEWDSKKLAALEQELDLLEEKLDKKVAEEQKKSEEMEKDNVKIKKEKKEKGDQEKKGRKDEPSAKKEGKKEKGEVKNKSGSVIEKLPDETVTEVVKEQPQKGNAKKDKETENQTTAGREKHESTRDSGTNTKKDEKEKNVDVKQQARSADSEREDKGGQERENQRGMRSREDGRRIKPEWRSVSIETGVESHGTRTCSSTSDREDGGGGSKQEMRGTDMQKGRSSRDVETHSRKEIKWTDSWTGTGEDRTVNNVRAERANRREEKRDVKEKESEKGWKKDRSREESRRSDESAVRIREWRSSTEESESKRSQCGRARDDRRERAEEKPAESVGGQADGEDEDKKTRRRRREDGDAWRRDREHERSRRGNRPRANALLGDGLYI